MADEFAESNELEHRELRRISKQSVSKQDLPGAWPPINAHLLGVFSWNGVEISKVWVKANENNLDAMFAWAYEHPNEPTIEIIWYKCAWLLIKLLHEEADPTKRSRNGWQPTNEVDIIEANK